MGKSSRYFSLILILIMAISSVSLFTAKPARAQTVPVPTFTMSTETSSYEIPTTYSTDPYTGANVTNLGYTLVSYNVSITIQNSHRLQRICLGLKVMMGHNGIFRG